MIRRLTKRLLCPVCQVVVCPNGHTVTRTGPDLLRAMHEVGGDWVHLS